NNVSFNNQYFPQDTNQQVSDITNSVALTKATKYLNQRVVVESLNAPDTIDTSTFPAVHVQTASIPRYDVTFYQYPLWKPASHQMVSVSTSPLAAGTTLQSVRPLLPLKPTIGPLLLSANGTLGQTYQRLDQQKHANGNGTLPLSQAIPLSRDWSFN